MSHCCGTIQLMKQKLYFIRHGHTSGTDRNLMYGATDIPVTERGLREIEKMADSGIYPDPDGAEIYTSGMIRTEQTLKSMYGAIEHRIAPLLREINLGKFEMRTIEEILEDDYGRQWLQGELEDPDFEGGDSFSGFKARTTRGIREIIEDCIKRKQERMIVVIHGAVIAAVMDHFFPNTYDDIWMWTPVPGSGFEVVLEDGKPISWKTVGEKEGGYVPRLQEDDI